MNHLGSDKQGEQEYCEQTGHHDGGPEGSSGPDGGSHLVRGPHRGDAIQVNTTPGHVAPQVLVNKGWFGRGPIVESRSARVRVSWPLPGGHPTPGLGSWL